MRDSILCADVTRRQIESFPPSHTSNTGSWSQISASHQEAPPGCLPWYTSPTESDGPRTSDLSPVSGYFDWRHASNNTSPLQFDDTVPHSASNFSHGRAASARTGKPLLLTPDDVTDRQRLSVPGANLHPFQHPQAFPQQRPKLEEPLSDTQLSPDGLLPSPISPNTKAEPSPEPSDKDGEENEKSVGPKNGNRWKAAHRAVERRYRSNLNLKIIKLGQCIPDIRHQINAVEDFENIDDSGGALKAKLQKGHVLAKAVDYILSLQQHVTELQAENVQLEGRVQVLNSIVQKEYPAQGGPVPLSQPSRALTPVEFPGSQRNAETRPVKSPVVIEREMPRSSESRSDSRKPVPVPKSSYSFVSENPSVASRRSRLAKSRAPKRLVG